jgi:uncharacterized protein (DUF983 family)
MTMTDQIHEHDEVPLKRLPPRSAWAAIKMGLRGRCPACGTGRLLYAYLKVNDRCASCDEEFFHHRADDFPPYVTIFVVGHILGAAMFAVDDYWPNLPMSYHFLIWPTLCVVLSLWLLPIFKGALVAYQWALRMHGFETAHPSLPQSAAKSLPTPVSQRSAA